MGSKYERYTTKFKRRMAELPYREVRRKNLDRVAEIVRHSMMVAGEMPLPEKWQSLVEQIEKARNENPDYLVVLLWRLLCNFSVAEKGD